MPKRKKPAKPAKRQASARLLESHDYGENDLFHFYSHFEKLTAAWSPKESPA